MGAVTASAASCALWEDQGVPECTVSWWVLAGKTTSQCIILPDRLQWRSAVRYRATSDVGGKMVAGGVRRYSLGGTSDINSWLRSMISCYDVMIIDHFVRWQRQALTAIPVIKIRKNELNDLIVNVEKETVNILILCSSYQKWVHKWYGYVKFKLRKLITPSK